MKDKCKWDKSFQGLYDYTYRTTCNPSPDDPTEPTQVLSQPHAGKRFNFCTQCGREIDYGNDVDVPSRVRSDEGPWVFLKDKSTTVQLKGVLEREVVDIECSTPLTALSMADRLTALLKEPR